MKMLQSCHIKIKNFLTWVAIYGQTRFGVRDGSCSQWKSELSVVLWVEAATWESAIFWKQVSGWNPAYVGFPDIWDGPVKSDGCFNQWMEQLSAVGSIIKIKKNKYMCICIKSLMAYILYKTNTFFKEKIISSSIHSLTVSVFKNGNNK